MLAENFTWIHRFRIWFEVGRWLTTIMLISIGLALTYHFLPDHKQPWRWFTPGTIFVTVMFVGASIGFDLYIGRFANYSRVYGALAGTIILLIWIYAFSLILLIGAEIDNSADKLKGQPVSA